MRHVRSEGGAKPIAFDERIDELCRAAAEALAEACPTTPKGTGVLVWLPDGALHFITSIETEELLRILEAFCAQTREAMRGPSRRIDA